MPIKRLFLVDLDHTLIYGSYAQNESAELLFSFSEFLKVYQRPFSKELVQLLSQNGDIIVYTTAKKAYAKMICQKLEINFLQLLSRNSCVKKGDGYRKKLKKEWEQTYNQVFIIDDSPNVWEIDSQKNVIWVVPSEFRGDVNDIDLQRIKNEIIQHIQSN
jgi:uncharacterized protein YlbG (UPF0298 family)